MAPDKSYSAFSALRRFASEETGKTEATEAAAPQELCDLCGASIPPDPEHRHLMEVATREILCVCRPCAILFDSEAASEGRYRIVPDRLLNLADFEMPEAQWENLRVPVDMAFFFYNTPAGKVVAYYPSPMGPTESLLELDTWEDLESRNPVLRGMQRDVEALLVNRARGASEHFLVPIDECYKLVGLIRTRWRGFSGGREVWDDITRFFEELGRRGKTVSVG
jgi:Family of unknown function (DUF5947)